MYLMREYASVQHIDWKTISRTNASRLKREMAAEDMDAVILGTMNNIHWLTGIPMTGDLPYFFSHFAILTQSMEEPLLLSPYTSTFFPEERKWIGDVRDLPFTKEIEDPTQQVVWHEEIVKVLREKTSAGQRIAVDPRLSIPLYEGIIGGLPEADFCTVSRVLSRARSVKGPEELKALRQSCAVAEMGMKAGLQILGVGVTERQVAGRVTEALYGYGATGLGFMPNIVAGERPGILFSSEKFVRPGELIRVDISSIWHGYYSCIARTAYTGNPPADIAAAYDALRKAHEQSLDYIKPGVTNYELYRFTSKKVEEYSDGKYSLPFFLGHGIGVSIIDEPWIFEESCCEEEVLEENMCFLFEPVLHMDGYGDLALTDCVAVTGSGVEVLTRTDRSLFTVIEGRI
jgi:Xaa-Pro aminopeptidase